METAFSILGLLVCLAGSFLYAGAETGFYSLSRAQVDVDASAGSRAARWVRWLLRDDSALLITLLIGNNLVLQLATQVGDDLLAGSGLSPQLSALIVALFLTPLVFLFGEALPKDLFRRRPQSLSYGVAGVVVASRVIFWPLERILRLVSAALERLFGLGRGRTTARPRERLTKLLAEGERQGVLPLRARILAENALALRSTSIETCMTPWAEVLTLTEGQDGTSQLEAVRSSRWTRLPVTSKAGAFLGYVHQLEVLAAGGSQAILEPLRPLPVFERVMPVDRALLLLRASGKRAAVVGTAERPVGLVTLKDLVEEISGDLTGI